MLIVPRGVEHMYIAEKEGWILLLESKTTVNTGEVKDERKAASQWI